MNIDEQLIKDLSDYIQLKTGIRYFSSIHRTPKDLMVSCPFHKGGQEKKPSFGIKLYSDEEGPMGLVGCFACKYAGTLSGVIKTLLGDKYNEDEVEAKFQIETTIARESIAQSNGTNKIKFKLPEKVDSVDIKRLAAYRGKYHKYLEYRHISPRTAQMYDIGYDELNDHITFPIRNIYNKCLGIGRRAIQEKQYIYPYEFVKPLYGVYELPNFVRHLWVVEGPFNLWSLYEYGKTGVALLGTGTQLQYE